MKKGRITKYELFTLLIALAALVFSGYSVFLQARKSDNIIFRCNPASYDGVKETFSFAAINLGNTAGMVNFDSIRFFEPGSESRSSFYLPVDKSIVIKPGEMETVSVQAGDIFSTIPSDNKKRNIKIDLSYVDSHGVSRSGRLSIGFLSISGAKRTLFTERAYGSMGSLPKDRGGHYVIIDDNNVMTGNPQMGFDKVYYKQFPEWCQDFGQFTKVNR